MREEDIIVGGQAVIEGVMMRAPNAYSVAVRKPTGEIISTQELIPAYNTKFPFLKFPVIRGSVALIHSMLLGVKALTFSANIAIEAEEEKEGRTPTKNAQTQTTIFAILPAIVFNLVIFLFLPLFLTNVIFLVARGETFSQYRQEVASQNTVSINTSQPSNITWQDKAKEVFERAKFYAKPVRPSLLFNLVDGIIRMILFLGFIALISRMEDIKRVFQYHGAEHKVVYNWESGEGLTVENSRRQPRQHPRCGTSFLMIVMLVSIITFSVIKFDSFWLNFLARIVLIPLVAGVSYEFIRFSARCLATKDGQLKTKNIWAVTLFKILTAPGLWLQNITTQEPSDDQLEVAIYALKQALELGGQIKQPSEALAAD
ncbi:MAG: DUF1385 domain-containing protein [Acidobacteria bacterium]|nr:DUF1385 domain-containing protein [Acidobacteriota bacterium]